MKRLIQKYANKLVQAGLAEPNTALLAGLDAEITWNRCAEERTILEGLFETLNINSLLFCRPAQPYQDILNCLTSHHQDTIFPEDCETRTFLHDLPIVRRFETASITEALKRRKSAIIPDRGIVTTGSVSPEQAFVVFSSVCFATFVKFFLDYLKQKRTNKIDAPFQYTFDRVREQIKPLPSLPPKLAKGPFTDEEKICKAMAEAGAATVQYELVDSYFGNISYTENNTLYISRTCSSLDELEGVIDPVPLDGSSCTGITASSELTAHREIIERTDKKAILHGHPRFSVILSMDCDKPDCENLGKCHIKCDHPRFVQDIPIVPGEVGTGPTGLCHTLPPALEGARGAIVYGHGVFTTGQDDFNEAFASLLSIEKMCMEEYFNRVNGTKKDQ